MTYYLPQSPLLYGGSTPTFNGFVGDFLSQKGNMVGQREPWAGKNTLIRSSRLQASALNETLAQAEQWGDMR